MDSAQVLHLSVLKPGTEWPDRLRDALHNVCVDKSAAELMHVVADTRGDFYTVEPAKDTAKRLNRPLYKYTYV